MWVLVQDQKDSRCSLQEKWNNWNMQAGRVGGMDMAAGLVITPVIYSPIFPEWDQINPIARPVFHAFDPSPRRPPGGRQAALYHDETRRQWPGAWYKFPGMAKFHGDWSKEIYYLAQSLGWNLTGKARDHVEAVAAVHPMSMVWTGPDEGEIMLDLVDRQKAQNTKKNMEALIRGHRLYRTIDEGIKGSGLGGRPISLGGWTTDESHHITGPASYLEDGIHNDPRK